MVSHPASMCANFGVVLSFMYEMINNAYVIYVFATFRHEFTPLGISVFLAVILDNPIIQNIFIVTKSGLLLIG